MEQHTPLLDYVARSSSAENLAVFKLLLAHGAKLGRRTLHLAAAAATDEKMALVRFLVEELGCDVNGMDVPEGEKYGNHYGTPVNYVAHGSGGGETVVRYLLEVRFLVIHFSILFSFALSFALSETPGIKAVLPKAWLTCFDVFSFSLIERRKSAPQRLLGSLRRLWLCQVGE